MGITPEKFEEGAVAYFSAKNGEEKLNALVNMSDLSMEEVIRRVAKNAPEIVVRTTLSGILLGLMDHGDTDLVMTTIEKMAKLAIDLKAQGAL